MITLQLGRSQSGVDNPLLGYQMARFAMITLQVGRSQSGLDGPMLEY